MDLEQFKSQWQQSAGGDAKPIEELHKILKMKTQKSMGRFRLRLILESVLLTFFLWIFYDWFDGVEKPWALNILLVMAVGGVILHNLYALQFIHLGLKGESLKKSLQFLSQRFRQQGGVAAILMVLYNVVWLTYMVVNVEPSPYVWGGMALAVSIILIVSFFTYQSWNKQARRMEDQLRDLEESEK